MGRAAKVQSFFESAMTDFTEQLLYDQLELDYDMRSIRCQHFMRDRALAAFRKWQEKGDKVRY